MFGLAWSAEEDAALARMAGNFSREAISVAIGRSVPSLNGRACTLGLKLNYKNRYEHWLTSEDKYLIRAVKGEYEIHNMVNALPRHSKAAIISRFKMKRKELELEGVIKKKRRFRMGQWTKADDRRLIEAVKQGKRASQMAGIFPTRTLCAINNRRFVLKHKQVRHEMITENSLVIEKQKPYRIGKVRLVNHEDGKITVMFDGDKFAECLDLKSVRPYNCDTPTVYPSGGL